MKNVEQGAVGGRSRMDAKELIKIGVFAAIYIVVISVAGFLGVIPVFVPLAAVLVPVLGGIPMMYYLSKVRKFGMVVVFSLLVGLIMFLGGMGYFSILTTLVFGLAAELILKAGGYGNAKSIVLAYAVQSMWIVGNFLPFVFARDAFLAQQEGSLGTAYAAQLSAMMPEWIVPILLVVSFASGLVGAFVGKRLYRKHFERAGIR